MRSWNVLAAGHNIRENDLEPHSTAVSPDAHAVPVRAMTCTHAPLIPWTMQASKYISN